MGIEGSGDHFFIHKHPEKPLSKPPGSTPIKKIHVPTDTIIPNKNEPSQKTLKPSTDASVPTLIFDLSDNQEDLNTQINKILKEYQLPDGKELENKLNKETTNTIADSFDSLDAEKTETGEIHSFFNLLSKLYPVTLAIASNFVGANQKNASLNFSEKKPQTIDELIALLEQNIDSLDISNETKTVLKKNAQELFEHPPEKLKQTLENLKLQGLPAENLSKTLPIFTSLQNLTPQEQKLLLSSLPTTQNTQTMALIGPSVEDVSNGISKFIQEIALNQKESSIPEQRRQLYSHAFKQAILSGALLGNMLIGKNKMEESETIRMASLKFQSAKELGIIDQIPFSFLAFFPDIRNYEDDQSDAIKTAKNVLLQLIRILLQLVFVLSALAGAGKKLGQKGMAQMIEENITFITKLLDNLIFALKKVDECYGINVNFHTAAVQSAKEGLALKNYTRF